MKNLLLLAACIGGTLFLFFGIQFILEFGSRWLIKQPTWMLPVLISISFGFFLFVLIKTEIKY